jgi:hypothetical protein
MTAGCGRAVERDELVLHFQPIFRCPAGTSPPSRRSCAGRPRARARPAAGLHPGRRVLRADRADRHLGRPPVLRAARRVARAGSRGSDQLQRLPTAVP